MTQTILPLQKAVYAALSGDSTLSAMITGVYNDVPQGTDYPYVVIGAAVARDISGVQTHKEQVQMTLSCYSRGRGAKETLDIANEVQRLLHRQSLTLDTGYTLEMLQVGRVDVSTLRDGITWAAVLQLDGRVAVE